MQFIFKVLNNFGFASLRVLGPKLYCRMIAIAVSRFLPLLQSRDLRPLDAAMGSYASRFFVKGQEIAFSCSELDEIVKDGTFSFGAVREIYIRDCYFAHQPEYVFRRMRTALDLGANRGCVTALLAEKCSKVIAVEANPLLAGTIKNSAVRNYKEDAVEVINAFVGEGGSFANLKTERVSIHDVISRFVNLDIDFIKMDIEGSEFAIFSESSWLKRVNSISMEVHRDHGDPTLIYQSLVTNGFNVICANEDLSVIAEPKKADYIYAFRLEKYFS